MSKKNKTIAIPELTIKSNNTEEQVRARKVFEDVRDRGKNGEALTEHEKDFFCTNLRHSLLDDGRPEDFTFCENCIFKYNYLVYHDDINGGGNYKKPDAKIRGFRNVGLAEASADLALLATQSNEWQDVISKDNHSEHLLQIMAIEYRKQLKELDSQPEFKIGSHLRGTFYHKGKRRALILHSKYVYLVVKEVFETIGSSAHTLKINGTEVEFTEHSLIHIVSRHYAPDVKQYNTGKSFLSMEFAPRDLHNQLGQLFQIIDNSGLYANDSINKITFKYKGIDYRVWIENRKKFVKGQGEVPYYRLDSFYPISDKDHMTDLSQNYSLAMINNELGVYCKK